MVATGATYIEKAELASNQLKDVAEAWRKICQDIKVIAWELFNKAFLERFFPREMREAKIEEFININQGSMTVRSIP